MEAKSIYVYLAGFVFCAVVVVLLIIYLKPKGAPAAQTAPQKAIEQYTEPSCDSCGDTNSDLSLDCPCPLVKSRGRFPIDLPSPDEPAGPSEGSCFNVLKYSLQ